MPDLPVTGYYRYTDIWFEWASALPVEDQRYPLKAVLSYDALTDPAHPLRLPGKDGIELYIGTFASGEARLLFSSAQVEYIRYWLHAMRLTQEPISLPYSECLIRRSSLQTLAPVVYKDAKSLKGAVKEIDKLNKRLKRGGADSSLTSRRIVFEQARALWLENRGVWFAIDIEAWDRDHTVLTELGWSLARWEDGKLVEECGHLLVKEHLNYTNTYVPERRQFYNFGESEVLKRTEFKTRVNALLDSLPQYGPVFLVFHDANQDIKFLRSPAIGAPLEGLLYLLPDSCKPGLFVVDTAELFGALIGDSHDRRALERMCNQLGVPAYNLHNAGNDAHYTLQGLRSMVEGGPLDMQREKRWPNKTQGIKVVENEDSDEDSDFEFYGWMKREVEASEQVPPTLPPKATDVIEAEVAIPADKDLYSEVKPASEVETVETVAVAA